MAHSSLIVSLTLACLIVAVSFPVVYLGVLTLLSRPLPVLPAGSRTRRFDIIVPAHNERELIASTVRTLCTLDWPADNFRILVVADNCSDETAALASAAGAQVWERFSTEQRGKGYALAYAFERCRQEARADALVVVDADTQVAPGLLVSMSAQLDAGAQAVQARYGISNLFASWRTMLMGIALGAFHDVRSRARERMGLSSGIRGNGWCVTFEALRLAPYGAFTLAEDLEFGIDLALAGIRVFYVEESSVLGVMAVSSRVASKQRQRWEAGRGALLRSRLAALLTRVIRNGDLVALDLVCDLLVPPLASLLVMLVLLTGIATWYQIYSGNVFPLAWCGVLALILAMHVARGWQLSGTGWRGFLALTHVPGYVLWKMLLLFRKRATEWIRTERERP